MPIPTLLDQTKSTDADVRYMALHDLVGRLQQEGGQALDARIEPAIVTQTLALLRDTHSDVKNLAVTLYVLVLTQSGHAQHKSTPPSFVRHARDALRCLALGRRGRA